MVTENFVPKSELFAQLRSIFTSKESGMLTLLTESKKSVLMRFSNGELTSTRCRHWEVEHTITALLEADNVKYSYMASASEDKDPLMAAEDFMMMIDPGGSGLESKAPLPKKSVVEAEVVTESVSASAAAAAEEVKQEGKDVDRAIAAKMNYF